MSVVMSPSPSSNSLTTALSVSSSPAQTAYPDTLNRVLTEVCTKSGISGEEGILTLREHVEEEVRDLSGEAFTKFLDNLYGKITTFIDSPNLTDNLGAVQAIDQLIDVQLGDNAAKISHFATLLRRIFETKSDPDTLVAASKALGHLALAGGALTADVVQTEVMYALNWLQGERIESRRLGATLILKEMARNAPTVFNVHVPDFMKSIWSALRDPKFTVREKALDALRECLIVIENRETRWRVQYYFHLFKEADRGLDRNASVESVHGSLLALGELLRNSHEFMTARYKSVTDNILKYRDHRDRMIRRSVTALIPRIANYMVTQFVSLYLGTCMQYLIGVLRNPAERDAGFASLGELAASVQKGLVEYLPVIAPLLKDGIGPRRGRVGLEALACVGQLAEAIGPHAPERMRQVVEGLLDCCFAPGLSPTLVSTMTRSASALPALLPTIQERMLALLSSILSSQRGRAGGQPSAGGVLSRPPDTSWQGLVQLALKTLCTFNFAEMELLGFSIEHVLKFMEDEDPGTRREAALCCCRLLEQSGTKHVLAEQQQNRGVIHRRRKLQIEKVLTPLLVTCVSDPDSGVRRAILSSLGSFQTLDSFLCQAESLTALLALLNDESYEVRELSMLVCGRLAIHNPGYVLPALRRHLLQVLLDLQHSADSKHKEESARFLGCIIRSCTRLILPYIPPILKVLVGKLKEGTAGAAVASAAPGGGGYSGLVGSVLVTSGELAKVGGAHLRPYLKELLPLIVETLEDVSVGSKREVAVVTLGQLVESTGYVVAPYTDYPQLLDLLLRHINGDLPWSTRRAVLQVLGILGALDPHVHKRNQKILALKTTLGNTLAEGTGQVAAVHAKSLVDNSAMELLTPSGAGTTRTPDEYYSTVAIMTLMKILHDGALSSYHQSVIKSLMYIFKWMGIGCVPYLPKVLPDLFQLMATCEDSLREYLLWQLAKLTVMVRQHIRKYLPDLLSLLYEYWHTHMLPIATSPKSASPILNLVEKLSEALNDEFRAYVPEVLPRCVSVLAEAERSSDYSRVLVVLHTFEVLGCSMEDHMHLLLPSLVRLYKPGLSNVPLDIQRAALRTLSRLLPCMQLADHAAAIVHPLMRVLDGPTQELRRDAVDAMCALAVTQGSDFSMFVPSIRKLMQRHGMQHTRFESIASRVQRREAALPVDITPPVPLLVPTLASSWSNSLQAQSNFGSSVDSVGSISEADPAEAAESADWGGSGQLKVNEANLIKAAENSYRSTKEDWAEWMRYLSVELLKESPSPALRTCASLALLQPHVARELFAAGFVSCWSEVNEGVQKQLVQSLEAAFASPNIPIDILATLLNLAEFMEHNDQPLPVDIRKLEALAEKCHAFAKALYYKEREFEAAPAASVEALIHINNQLQQHDAALGILVYTQHHLSVDLKESWYEKLQRWEDALAAYEGKLTRATSSQEENEVNLGRMRCYSALARWNDLAQLCRATWDRFSEEKVKMEVAPLGAQAAWNMQEWDEMAKYVAAIDQVQDGAFYQAVLCVRRGNYSLALDYVERARKLLATDLAALVLESYERSYSDVVRVQQLAELEEVIDYCTLPEGSSRTESRRALIRGMWEERICGAQKNVDVWQAILAVRSLVLPMDEDCHTWLKFASLCRKNGRINQASYTLDRLMQLDMQQQQQQHSPSGGPVPLQNPYIKLAFLKHMWSVGGDSDRRNAFRMLQNLMSEFGSQQGGAATLSMQAGRGNMIVMQGSSSRGSHGPVPALESSSLSSVPIMAKVCEKLGSWSWALHPSLTDATVAEISRSLRAATEAAPQWGKAWHKWALFNTTPMNHFAARGNSAATQSHVAAAVFGYFQSISLGPSFNKQGRVGLQDILRLLTLWFSHGNVPEVRAVLQEGFAQVNIDTWLVVIPQIIARIHSSVPALGGLIQDLLVRIGRHHPQAILFPLLIASNSQSAARRSAATSVLDHMRSHSGPLVDQAKVVSFELIRVAISWHEMWHEALEDASRLYFGEKDDEGMLAALAPLHEMLAQKQPETEKEESFVAAHGSKLNEAFEFCEKFKVSRREADMGQAWDLYYSVFKSINKQLPTLTTLELQDVSPSLVQARDLDLAVPGTYRAGSPVVTVASFAQQIQVITSKQRPRKISINGSDGSEYVFLLKGHEDLRLDERVMQLFTLVNGMLRKARAAEDKDLSIERYAVVPLSPNSGLIGWLPHCDTLHQLIRDYREARNLPVNAEHRVMLAFAPDYDHLTLMSKVEVFEHALANTPGDDLAKVLWLKSRNSEVWLQRRTNYTRSLAVMSMVGYLLGLGDRHPSNLMLDRYSGKVIHIDFGDCFEASMSREKFPERVPFRLTRMLEKAMEVSGIEGNFRTTCESVMQILRGNQDSVMAMMEAFVHDPLINWRLVAGSVYDAANLGDANDALNERAMAVMTRMSNKLTGRDFTAGALLGVLGDGEPGLTVKVQVQRLIDQATSSENLCQSYIGWCPFW